MDDYMSSFSQSSASPELVSQGVTFEESNTRCFSWMSTDNETRNMIAFVERLRKTAERFGSCYSNVGPWVDTMRHQKNMTNGNEVFFKNSWLDMIGRVVGSTFSTNKAIRDAY